jgi:hypothetical protein
MPRKQLTFSEDERREIVMARRRGDTYVQMAATFGKLTSAANASSLYKMWESEFDELTDELVELPVADAPQQSNDVQPTIEKSDRCDEQREAGGSTEDELATETGGATEDTVEFEFEMEPLTMEAQTVELSTTAPEEAEQETPTLTTPVVSPSIPRGNEVRRENNLADEVAPTTAHERISYAPPSRPVVQINTSTLSDGFTSGVGSEDDKAERKELLLQLRLYLEKFGNKLADKLVGYNKAEHNRYLKSCNTLTMLELRERLNQVKGLVASKNVDTVIRQTFLAGATSVETLGTQVLDLKIQGYAALLSRSEDIDDILKELTIKHYSKISKYVEPEYRLIVLMGASMLQLDGANRRAELLQEHVKAPMSKEAVNNLEEKYSDL